MANKCRTLHMRLKTLQAICTLDVGHSGAHQAIPDEYHHEDGACKVGCPHPHLRELTTNA